MGCRETWVDRVGISEFDPGIPYGFLTSVVWNGTQHNIPLPPSGSRGYRVSSAGSGNVSLTGFIAGTPNQTILLFNDSATKTLRLKHQNGGSLPGNRISNIRNTNNAHVYARGSTWIRYDAILGSWTMIQSDRD